MPFPYFENVSIDFTGTWSSSRKRPTTSASEPPAPPPKRTRIMTPCPHSMTVVQSTRQTGAEKKQCPICFEDYFSTPPNREKITPVQLGCSHIFCRQCVELHFSASIRCPLPWCKIFLPWQLDNCVLCAYWERDQVAQGSLVVTVRANEMLASITDASKQEALDNDMHALSQIDRGRLLNHVRTTLKRYEWQFHSGVDLGELLDPFLCVINVNEASAYYGPKLSPPTWVPSTCPLRTNDPDDYPPGKEPWIAGFFRRWVLEYVKENGEVEESWGVWAKKTEQDCCESPYKRILTHMVGSAGHVEYLVKWVGQRHYPSWVRREHLDEAGRKVYDDTHGIVHEDERMRSEA